MKATSGDRTHDRTQVKDLGSRAPGRARLTQLILGLAYVRGSLCRCGEPRLVLPIVEATQLILDRMCPMKATSGDRTHDRTLTKRTLYH